MRLLAMRVVTVLGPLVVVSVASCTAGPTSAPSTSATHSAGLPAAGAPGGYNSDDVGFATNMVAHYQKALEVSALVQDRSTNSGVIAVAAQTGAGQKVHFETLKALLVQWNEDPDYKSGGGAHGSTAAVEVDDATIAHLNALHGADFDALWLQSMIRFEQGALELASAEIAHGKDVDAVNSATQIATAENAEIAQMNQLLGR
jgi:uncharacterized protein (DUF305 family)